MYNPLRVLGFGILLAALCALSATAQLGNSKEPVEQPNVLVRLYVVDDSDPGAEVSDEVRATVKEALSGDAAESASIKELAVLRSRAGSGAEVSWSVPQEGNDGDMVGPLIQKVSVGVNRFEAAEDKGIGLSLVVGMDIPIVTGTTRNPNPAGQALRRIERHNFGIQTEIDVKDGETVLVGKAHVRNSTDQSWLFVQVDILD